MDRIIIPFQVFSETSPTFSEPNASANWVYDEFKKSIETLNLLAEKIGSRGYKFCKKMKSPKCFGILDILKVIFASLTTLLKSFQTEVINFSRIISNFSKFLLRSKRDEICK